MPRVPFVSGPYDWVGYFHLSPTSTDASESKSFSDAETNMTVPALRELAATPKMRQLITHFSEPGGAGEARRLSEENAVRASDKELQPQTS